MDLIKRLELDADLIKSVSKILDQSKQPETTKEIKEEKLEEFRQTAVSTTDATPQMAVDRVRSRLNRPSIGGTIARRAASSVGGVATGLVIPDNNTPDTEQETDLLRQATPPEQRDRMDRIRSGQEQGRFNDQNPSITADPTPQSDATPAAANTTPPTSVTATTPPPPAENIVTVTATRLPRTPSRTAADDSADRLNAISLGQTVVDRGGTPDADATPRNSGEENAANNMRRRRREISNEETSYLQRTKKKKVKNPQIEFNPDIEKALANEAVVTKGKITSSKRITKTLQDIISKNQAKEYKFEDGTSVKIEPAMARIALTKYNAKSDFEKAQAAKVMRNSYKEFLTSIR